MHHSSSEKSLELKRPLVPFCDLRMLTFYTSVNRKALRGHGGGELGGGNREL